jgi:hypothetical protein
VIRLPLNKQREFQASETRPICPARSQGCILSRLKPCESRSFDIRRLTVPRHSPTIFRFVGITRSNCVASGELSGFYRFLSEL